MLIKQSCLFFVKFFHLYKDGFKNPTLGKTLWKVIFIKHKSVRKNNKL